MMREGTRNKRHLRNSLIEAFFADIATMDFNKTTDLSNSIRIELASLGTIRRRQGGVRGKKKGGGEDVDLHAMNTHD